MGESQGAVSAPWVTASTESGDAVSQLSKANAQLISDVPLSLEIKALNL